MVLLVSERAVFFFFVAHLSRFVLRLEDGRDVGGLV